MQTGQTLDLQLKGKGCLSSGPNNTAEDSQSFTRDGSFSLDKDGFIVTTDGQRVLSEQGQFMQVPFTRKLASVN